MSPQQLDPSWYSINASRKEFSRVAGRRMESRGTSCPWKEGPGLASLGVIVLMQDSRASVLFQWNLLPFSSFRNVILGEGSVGIMRLPTGSPALAGKRKGLFWRWRHSLPPVSASIEGRNVCPYRLVTFQERLGARGGTWGLLLPFPLFSLPPLPSPFPPYPCLSPSILFSLSAFLFPSFSSFIVLIYWAALGLSCSTWDL